MNSGIYNTQLLSFCRITGFFVHNSGEYEKRPGICTRFRYTPLFLIFLLPLSLIADDFSKILQEKQKQAENMTHEEFFRKTLKESLEKAKEVDLTSIQQRNEKILENTAPCFIERAKKETHDILIFASFSMPDSLWKEYSESLCKVGGAFVLRGLPGDSFQELSCALNRLKKQGVVVPIILDPKSFEKYNIEVIPSIVLATQDTHHKISGAVSLEYALELFAKGENAQ